MDIYDIIMIFIIFCLLFILMNNHNCSGHYDSVYMADIADLKKKYTFDDVKPFNY